MGRASGIRDGRIDHGLWTSCGRIPLFVVPATYSPFMVEITHRNERLAEAMARAGMTSADLAAAAQVDPRTIDRLVADRSRIPRARSRHAISEAVHVPVGMLWPSAAN